jgi:hypothetical protein
MQSESTTVYLLSPRTVRRPVSSGIEKRGSRHTSQEVCRQRRFVQVTGERDYRLEPDEPEDLRRTASLSLVNLMRMARTEWASAPAPPQLRYASSE